MPAAAATRYSTSTQPKAAIGPADSSGVTPAASPVTARQTAVISSGPASTAPVNQPSSMGVGRFGTARAHSRAASQTSTAVGTSGSRPSVVLPTVSGTWWAASHVAATAAGALVRSVPVVSMTTSTSSTVAAKAVIVGLAATNSRVRARSGESDHQPGSGPDGGAVTVSPVPRDPEDRRTRALRELMTIQRGSFLGGRGSGAPRAHRRTCGLAIEPEPPCGSRRFYLLSSFGRNAVVASAAGSAVCSPPNGCG